MPNSLSPLLEPALLTPSPRYAAAAIIRNFGLYVVALASVPLLAGWRCWAPFVALPLIGLAYYRLTLVMHDCIHGTLLRRTQANRGLGIFLGALSGIEFRAFSRLHWQHHRIVGQPDDPQGADYLVGWSATPMALVVHLVRPLTGGTLFKLGQVFHALERSDPRHSAPRMAALALVVGAQLGVATTVSDGWRLWWLAPLPIVSAATFGLFFAQLRGFAEHVAMPVVEPEGFVRSHRATMFGGIFLYDLNFNFHREHHLFPAVPSCRLPELHRRLAAVGEADDPVPGMLETVRQRMAAARRKYPSAESVGA